MPAVIPGRRLSARQVRQRLSGSSQNSNMEAELTAVVTELVSFQGCAELLRASRLYTLLSCCAAIFESNEGSAETWVLSKQVQRIDFFVSHNWVVKRMKKFLCLALHFNLRSALLAQVVTMVAIVAARGPGFGNHVWEAALHVEELGDLTRQHALTAHLLLVPIFLLVLFFGHEMQRLAGWRGASVFLDKTCIHQDDQMEFL